MGFETSTVAATAGQGIPQANPIQTIEGLAGLQNSLNQNRMFQAKTAAGGYLTRSMGPDGRVDPQALNRFLQSDPRTAPYAPEILGEALQMQGQGISNETNSRTLAGQQAERIRQALATVPPSTNKDPKVAEMEDALNGHAAITRLVQAGAVSPEIAGTVFGTRTLPDGSNLDEATAHAMDIQRRAAILGGAGGAGAMEAQYGENALVDTGGAIQPTTINRVTGATAPIGAPVDKTLSPEARVSRVPVLINGRPSTVPQGAIADAHGNPVPVPGLTGPHGEMAATYTPEEQATGAAVGSTLGQGAATQVQDLATAVQGSAQRKTLLTEMGDIIKAGDFRTGPHAQQWANLVTDYNSTFGTHYDTSGAAGEQVFSKIAEQFAAAQQKAAGRAATDAQTSATRLANPNSQFSPEANQEVIAQLLGNEDLIQHQMKAYNYWKSHGGKPQDYGTKFAPAYTQRFNPLFFQEQYMTPLQKKTVFGAMKPAEKAAYDAAKAKYMAQELGE